MSHKARIYLTCGSGGVGKTTISAALGLKCAIAGEKTIVLTIDPAKRLADSLGLDSLSDTPTQIKLPPEAQGEMWAMMLDTKRTFDRIVETYASSADTKDKILNNKLYQHMSQMLAGTHEYMAMERLYEIYQQGIYTTIIVDTPPMQNAVDFLKAPQKMMNMINNSMLHLLLKPTLSLGKSGFNLFQKGSQQILKVFDRITGFAFLQDLSEMIVAFKDLLGGFENRAAQVHDLLSNHLAKFIIVCTTQQNSIREAQEFYDQLSQSGFDFHHMIVNRVYTNINDQDLTLKSHKESLSESFNANDCNHLDTNYKKYTALIKRDQNHIQRLKDEVGNEFVQTIPLFLSDVHDLDTLKKISNSMTFEL